MRIRTRIAFAVGATSLVGGIALGVWFGYGTRSDAVNELDRVITGAINSVRSDPTKDASAVLEYANTISVPLSVNLFFENLPSVKVLQQSDGQYPLDVPEFSIPQLERATSAFRNVTTDIHLRYRSYKIDDGQWLVVAASMRSIDSGFSRTFERAMFSSLVEAIIFAFVVNLVVRRQLRPVEDITRKAQQISSGDLDVHLSAVDRKDEIGDLSGALTSMIDSLTIALETRTGTERRMREFLGDTSHELRTPLTVIRGYVDILNSGRELLPEQRERALTRLSSESRRMDSIINDLLLLSEMGEVHVDLDDVVDVTTIVKTFARDLIEQQPGRSVKTEVADGVVLRGNIALLERLMANIVSNIRQHTSPTVPVEFRLVANDASAMLTVDDAGPGLAEHLYQRVTEGFQRFDRHRSAEGGGFGLGLSIISSIVEAHHGTLSLERSSLGGLRTVITLPRRHILDKNAGSETDGE